MEKHKTYHIALAGNPNVGKSTIFNALTGLNQHTGNWAGKTVENARGEFTYKNNKYIVTDLPGTYSLMAHSAEEIVARDFICFGGADMVIVVCDATCLERNLNLALQAMEITDNIIICVNLMDEAKKKQIYIDIEMLKKNLGVPIVQTSARSEAGLDILLKEIEFMAKYKSSEPVRVKYLPVIEEAIQTLQNAVEDVVDIKYNPRWISLKLLDYDKTLINTLNSHLNFDILSNEKISKSLDKAKSQLEINGYSKEKLKDTVVSNTILTAEGVCADSVYQKKCSRSVLDRKIDRIVTNRWTGIPIMLFMLIIILWLTIVGANYPSQLLSEGFGLLEEQLLIFFKYINMPVLLYEVLVLGIYRVLTWVIAVMLPPMAIFFPLFTLLEDLGFLPRIAFNLDRFFKNANACGKQALTMCICNI